METESTTIRSGELVSGRERAQATQLSQLSGDIKREAKIVEVRLRSTLKHALMAGKLLCQAKKMTGHGHWLEWFVSSEFEFSEVTAQRYMRLWRRWPEIQDQIAEAGEPASLDELTYSDALNVLGNRKLKAVPQLATATTQAETDSLPGLENPVASELGSDRPEATANIGATGDLRASLDLAEQMESDIRVIQNGLNQMNAWVPKRDKYIITSSSKALSQLAQRMRRLVAQCRSRQRR